MALIPQLRSFSSKEWTDIVLDNFDAFLQDHADGERKVAANSMGLIAKYPDKVEMIPELVQNAIEELVHFKMVYKLMLERGVQLRHSIPKDEYAVAMIKKAHSGRVERFLDRLLIVSISEVRGKERFGAMEEVLEDPQLKSLYRKIRIDEEKHGTIFIDLALMYFDEDVVAKRIKYWEDVEDEIFNSIPLRPAIH
jgi:tRNA-(ms[2]io[6]A)-hydroxylase